MDPEIQFGEVEHAAPTVRQRPDQNGQWLVRSVYRTAPGELPIFVELDVLQEVLQHATSDRRVELGGVLLGEACVDEQGEPFVVIRDCLRARHYESTKGSFKFTHETWEQVTHDRESLPADLHMVGWYHTHPGWGVFLSGLDLFICDHFFNKALDVALVVDPCQGDTGFFQWLPQGEERIRRTAGYRVFASRFRQRELDALVQALENHVMPDSTNSSTAPISVHLPPSAPQPFWQTLAVLGMLGTQFCLVLVLTLRILVPPATGTREISSSSEIIAAKPNLSDRVGDREALIDAKLDVLESVLRRDGDLPNGVLTDLAARTEEADQLRGSLRAQQSLAKELDAKITGLESNLAEVRRREESRREEIAALQTKLGKLTDELNQKSVTLAAKTSSAPPDENGWTMKPFDGKSTLLGTILGAVVAAVVALALLRKQPSSATSTADGDSETNATHR